MKINNIEKQPPNIIPMYSDFTPEQNTVFNSGIVIIKSCPAVKPIKFEISRDVSDKLEYLQAHFPNVEFLVYGHAEKIGNTNEFQLKDIVIPNQTAYPALVKNVEQKGSFNTVIHKHPGDNPGGFSNTDIEYINSNHTFSLVIGSKNMENIVSSCRMFTDCQKYILCPIDVHIAPRLYVDDDKFRASISNIKTKIDFFDTISNIIFGNK